MEMYSGKCIKLLLIGIVLMTLVRDNDAWWSRRRRQPPPPRPKPDRTKPTFTYCPTRLGPYYQTNRTHLDLSWEIPRATDNSGYVEVTETREPFVFVLYDDYTIAVQYRATDRAGNYATCSFMIEVHVIRCQTLRIYYGNTRCSNTDSVSSVCTHSCFEGYYFVGSRTRTCYRSGNNAYWTGSKSYCTPVTCPVPVSDVTTVSCSYRGESSMTSERQNYTTYCIYECKDGYSYVEGSVSRRCLASGDWDGIPLLCRDITPPELVCPDEIVLTADPLMTSIQWSRWEPIVASDLGIDIEATTHSINSTAVGSNRPSSLPEGYHTLVYRAVDSSGNEANCSFTVTVRVCRCPPLSLPDKSIVTLVSGVGSCNGRVVYGSVCAVSCEIGYTLSSGGTSLNKTCLISDQNLNGTWSGPDPVCDRLPCEALSATTTIAIFPENCLSDPRFGDACILECRQSGFKISPLGLKNVTCSNDQTWTGEIEEAQCVDLERPTFRDCPSDIVAFANRSSDRANVKWSILVQDNDQSQEPVVTCNHQPGTFSIGDYVVSCIALDGGGNEASCVFNVEVMARHCEPLTLPLHGIANSECERTYGSMCNISCSEGYQLVGSSNGSCEFDGSTMFWQFEEEPVCTNLPHLTKLALVLTASAREFFRTFSTLTVSCPAGTFSKNGFYPCERCPVGFYQPHIKRTSCIRCAGNTTTSLSGATSIESCHIVN